MGVTMSLMLRMMSASSSVETESSIASGYAIDRADIDGHRGGVSAAIAVADGYRTSQCRWKFASGVKVTVPSELRTTVPLVGLETAEITSVSPSRSASLA